jgi:hypothetical protein
MEFEIFRILKDRRDLDFTILPQLNLFRLAAKCTEENNSSALAAFFIFLDEWRQTYEKRIIIGGKSRPPARRTRRPIHWRFADDADTQKKKRGGFILSNRQSLFVQQGESSSSLLGNV